MSRYPPFLAHRASAWEAQALRDYDYDYHPNEPDVRVFEVPEAWVLVRTDQMYLGQTHEPASSK